MSYLFSIEVFITLCKIKVNFFHSFVICAGNFFFRSYLNFISELFESYFE